MAAATGAFKTYESVGNREDLTDDIYNIDPKDTPFVSMVERTKATAVTHEWQKDSYANPADNAVVEANVVTPSTSSPTTRLQNICQIVEKSWSISGTQEAVKKAGRASEVAYQKMKRGVEVRLDIEYAMVGRATGQVAGDATTARKLRSFESWISSNASRGAGGAAATAATAAPTDATTGDLRTFAESHLQAVLKSAYDNGSKANVLMVGSFNKQKASTFSGRAVARANVSQATILGAADLYVSDFGDIKIVPNRVLGASRGRTALLIDPDMVAVAYLRPIGSEDLAKRGDATEGFMNAEMTLEMRNEAAHGVIADLTTS